MSKFTLPKQLVKKQYRKIIVNDTMYAWKADSSGITIFHTKSKTYINAIIEHRANYLVGFKSNGEKSGTFVMQEHFSVKPSYIRKVILYTITKGWKYKSNIVINLHKEVPLNNHIEFNFPELTSQQVAITAYARDENNCLIVLDKLLQEYNGKYSFYKILKDIEKGEKYLIDQKKDNIHLELWMSRSEEFAIAKAKAGIINYFSNKETLNINTMNAITLLIYNVEVTKYKENDLLNTTPINFLEVFSVEIGEFNSNGNHNNLIKEKFKMYCHQTKDLKGFTEIMIGGNSGVNKILEIAEKYQWTIMHPTSEGLINLNKYLQLDSTYLDEYLQQNK